MYWQPGITVRTIILLSCLLCRVKSSNSRQLLCHRQIRFGAQLLYKTRLDGQLISLTLLIVYKLPNSSSFIRETLTFFFINRKCLGDSFKCRILNEDFGWELCVSLVKILWETVLSCLRLYCPAPVLGSYTEDWYWGPGDLRPPPPAGVGPGSHCPDLTSVSGVGCTSCRPALWSSPAQPPAVCSYRILKKNGKIQKLCKKAQIVLKLIREGSLIHLWKSKPVPM